jgi:hypothetical protein
MSISMEARMTRLEERNNQTFRKTLVVGDEADLPGQSMGDTGFFGPTPDRIGERSQAAPALPRPGMGGWGPMRLLGLEESDGPGEQTSERQDGNGSSASDMGDAPGAGAVGGGESSGQEGGNGDLHRGL